ncbi:ferredoxin [Microbacterium sp. NPDC055910]|uniref:ferredoxin n=1 Tax=Microbacterium sp. NPDC055910 TaxID=3345659 RepID=UPI0035DB2906
MDVSVDQKVCQGHGVCLMMAPDLFEISDETGLAYVKKQPQTEEEREAARAAQGNCPERAIRIGGE